MGRFLATGNNMMMCMNSMRMLCRAKTTVLSARVLV